MKSARPRHSDPRVFLNLSQPPLVSAAQWACQKFAADPDAQFEESLIVLPTSRSCQRFLQLLIAELKQAGIQSGLPQVITIGELPEYLYAVQKPLANDLCQQLAWVKALQQSPPWELQELFGQRESMTTEQWQPFARLISQLHQRLGADIWSFRSVVREVQELDRSFGEIKRWQALEAIQGRYYELLDEVGLWDRQAARSVAVRRELCRAEQRIVLVGVADLNRVTRSMLEQIRDKVTVLVAAPGRWKDRFNEFGGLTTDKWMDPRIKFPSDCMRVVDRAEDQAFAVVSYLDSLEGAFSCDQITVGIPDDAVEPQVERALSGIGAPVRNVRGQPIKSSAPVRLMIATVEYLERSDFTTFAALVRHPDLFSWIARRLKSRTWLADLDEFQRRGLPDQFGIWQSNPFGEPDDIGKQHRSDDDRAAREIARTARLNEVHAQVAGLLKPLARKPAPIARWTGPWSSFLSKVYGSRTLNRNRLSDQQTITACHELHRALHDNQQVPGDWKLKTTAAQAMQLAIEAASEAVVVPPPVQGAIELAGWLDLTLDDAPVMIVTGMNDESVPASEQGHLFLPDSLCRELGILDNDRRYARDAYALSVITAVRENVLLVSGRHDRHGDPLKPSRLLFADEDEVIASRARAFFSFDGKSESRFWLADPAEAPATQQFPIPQPQIDEPINSMRVTAFRDYIKCPYRFYLAHVLRLDESVDNYQELDGGAFGTMLHDVVEDFGRSEVRDSTDAKQIRKFLDDRLDFWATIRYRGSRLPALRVQLEQLRVRLALFAEFQAARAGEGWQIVSVEELLKHNLEVDGEPFEIRGTIDRIDFHPGSGAVAIWDYKTSDAGDGPDKVHRTRNGWKDLQLPLYRHLAKENDAVRELDLASATLGFIVLPRELDKSDFAIADWSESVLQSADEEAFSIIRQIRQNRFWPPVLKAPQYTEKFAAICQDNIFERYRVNSSRAEVPR